MKIAFFVWEFWPRLVGGLGTYAIEVTKEYVKMGHEVTVFTINDGTLKTEEKWNGIEIHRPLIADSSYIFPLVVREDLKRWGKNLKFFSDVFSYNYLSASKFINLLVKKLHRKFDIVAYHDWLSAFAGVMIQHNLSMPTVFHMHSVEEQRSLGHGSQTVKEIEREAAKDAKKVITVSYSMKEFLSSLGYESKKIEVVHNGVDPKKYDPRKVNETIKNELIKKHKLEGKKIILFVGRLTWIKGVHNLIKAMPEILSKHPDVKLVILGKGEEYTDLIHLAQTLRIFDKVEIRSEWVPEEERIAYYSLADVCVFPSLNEPFGIVSLEAMAMEKPVVVGASGVNGLKEQVIPNGPNRTGVHVNGNDPHDIAWGVNVVLDNLEEARKWGKNGRRRVIENFTVEKCAMKTLSIYRKIIENSE